MIVVDTNIIAHTWLPSELSKLTKLLIDRDADWIVPLLWRSEFRSVLVLYIRKGVLELRKAKQIARMVEDSLLGQEYEVPSEQVLDLVGSSDLSAYDCEFVALAKAKNLPLITVDKRILACFPEFACGLEAFLR